MNVQATCRACRDVDGIDFQIYAELFPDRRFTMRGLDPRLSAETIGARVGIGRSAVRERLLAWERDGFLTDQHVVPSVHALGARLVGVNARVDDPTQRPAFLDAVQRIEGAFGALEYVGEWVALIFAVPDNEEAQESDLVQQVARIRGVREATRFSMFHAPTSSSPLSPLDWRIVRALREDPKRTLDKVAEAVGVSTRTVRRRYDRLLAEEAVWFVPTMDFRRMSGAVVRVNLWLRPRADRHQVAAAMRKRFPGALETAMAPGELTEPVMAWMRFDSAALVEETRRELQSLEGVDEAELLFPVRTMLWPAWVEQRMTAIAPATEGRSPTVYTPVGEP